VTKKKIAIVGSGANGSSIGADLIRAGLDVTLVEQWPEHVAAMRERGLRIEMPEETVEVPVRAHDLCDVATFRDRFDVALVLVKAYDTDWACRLIAPHVAADGLVIGVQNGMTTATVAAAVGAERTLGCVIEVSSMMTVPGVVERHSPPDRSYFAVGGGSREKEELAAELLGWSGRVEIAEDIEAAKWMKLVSNCTTLVGSAILGLPIPEAPTLPGMRELMVQAGREALALGAEIGHPVRPIFGLSAEEMNEAEDLVGMMLDVLIERFCLPHTTSTILHDWGKGRHSEVDDINGLVVAERERRGGAAPANAAIVEVAHRIERGELAPEPGNLELLLDLAGQAAAR
jgi:2-dehydropantoate 2-reductase